MDCNWSTRFHWSEMFLSLSSCKGWVKTEVPDLIEVKCFCPLAPVKVGLKLKNQIWLTWNIRNHPCYKDVLLLFFFLMNNHWWYKVSLTYPLLVSSYTLEIYVIQAMWELKRCLPYINVNNTILMPFVPWNDLCKLQ